MATRRKTTDDVSDSQSKRSRQARSPEEREDQLVNLAFNLAERQIREGTVSSQVLTHYLKLGSSREKLEQERIRNENSLMGAKIDLMASQQRIEELYADALNAMRSYQGQPQTPTGDE